VTAVRPRVVIIGGGFGGISAARALRKAPVDVTLFDRTNHHVFQPLLYQVATGTLSPSEIAVPIRWLFRRQPNVDVHLGDVNDIDADARRIVLDGGARTMDYDFLIVAAGSRHSYFGHDEWEPTAPGLKTVPDAIEIRERFLLAFELAEKTEDPVEREALQTIVIVGGGPTGVELAGIMVVIARRALAREFRHADPTTARIVLVEGGPRLLPSFPEKLSERTRRDLEELGVEVRLNTIVGHVDANGVQAGDERIATRTVFWAAGNSASSVIENVGVARDRVGRALVAPDLSVPAHPEIFIVGDLAVATQKDGRPVPGVAQGAIQGGACAARNVLRTIRRQPREPFRYRNKGDLATIGRHKAVADFGWLTLSGILAWWLWLFIHILYLASFRNRLLVLMQWAFSYFTYQRGVRLILGRTRGHGS
jgi:NADH:ubiquinone reductase (H+-translocating)